MSIPEKFYDLEGTEVSLDILCRREPAWAANQIRGMYLQCDSLRHRVAELGTALGRLLEEVDDINGWRPTSLSPGGSAYDAALAALRRKEEMCDKRGHRKMLNGFPVGSEDPHD